MFDHNIIYLRCFVVCFKVQSFVVYRGADTRQILNSTFVSVETEPRAQCECFFPHVMDDHWGNY